MELKFFLMLMIVSALIAISCSEDGALDEGGSISALDTVNVVITKDSSCFIASKLKATAKITGKTTGLPVTGFIVNVESKAYYRTVCGTPGLADWNEVASGSGTTNGAGVVVIELNFPPSSYAGADYKYIDYVRAK